MLEEVAPGHVAEATLVILLKSSLVVRSTRRSLAFSAKCRLALVLGTTTSYGGLLLAIHNMQTQFPWLGCVRGRWCKDRCGGERCAGCGRAFRTRLLGRLLF